MSIAVRASIAYLFRSISIRTTRIAASSSTIRSDTNASVQLLPKNGIPIHCLLTIDSRPSIARQATGEDEGEAQDGV